MPACCCVRAGWRPLQVAVHVEGQLNAGEGSRGWSVELALPWSLLQQAANRQVPPAPGGRSLGGCGRQRWGFTMPVIMYHDMGYSQCVPPSLSVYPQLR